jgi:hypothetical protein
MSIEVVLGSVHMDHISDPQAAEHAAAGVRAFMASYNVECEILPAGDRVVIHMPLDAAEDLVMAAHLHGRVLRYPNPEQLRLFDDHLEPTFAY